MSLTFKKNIEDFECLKCGFNVKGNGYTNHCPKCLYSQHVDINPGDRLSECKGLMKPIKLENIKGEFKITHKCLKCEHQKINILNRDDDFDTALKEIKNI